MTAIRKDDAYLIGTNFLINAGLIGIYDRASYRFSSLCDGSLR
jgi:hypothetical protein